MSITPNTNTGHQLISQLVSYTPVGLEIHRALTWEEYEAIGAFLDMADEAIKWWWGDWLAYGERTYGETYAQAAAIAKREVKTMQNYAYVASNVTVSRRREDLSWTHHAAVASRTPDEQSRLLALAADEGLSSKDLAAHAAGEHWITCDHCHGRGRIKTE